MSFWSSLFGQKDGSNSGEKTPVVMYEGYAIKAAPQKDGDQFRLAGTITKTIEGQEKEHFIIRADVFSSKESATEATIAKAKRLIDEQGERIF